jgi:NAD(P)H dehydrogenase (quinone)
MHVYILYAHPARESFCRAVLHAFTRGLEEAGHTADLNDLYLSGFACELDEGQYRREVGRRPEAPVPPDVRAEQARVEKADALAFIYPVWWSDCPAKLKGWFDRVWSYGYAYFYDSDCQRGTHVRVPKAVVICPAGHTTEHLEETGVAEAMRRIMLQDRLLGVGIREARLEILGGMMPGDDTWREPNLERAYRLGREL